MTFKSHGLHNNEEYFCLAVIHDIQGYRFVLIFMNIVIENLIVFKNACSYVILIVNSANAFVCFVFAWFLIGTLLLGSSKIKPNSKI